MEKIMEKITHDITKTYEDKQLFNFDGFYYLRVEKVVNGEYEMYWSNVMMNNDNPNYSYDKWNTNYSDMEQHYLKYLRKTKLEKLLS